VTFGFRVTYFFKSLFLFDLDLAHIFSSSFFFGSCEAGVVIPDAVASAYGGKHLDTPSERASVEAVVNCCPFFVWGLYRDAQVCFFVGCGLSPKLYKKHQYIEGGIGSKELQKP